MDKWVSVRVTFSTCKRMCSTTFGIAVMPTAWFNYKKTEWKNDVRPHFFLMRTESEWVRMRLCTFNVNMNGYEYVYVCIHIYQGYDADADDTVIEIHDATTQWINVMMRSNVHRKQTDSITSSCEYAHTHTRAQKNMQKAKREVSRRKRKQFNYSHWIMRVDVCVCVCFALCAHGTTHGIYIGRNACKNTWDDFRANSSTKSKHSSEWIWTSFNVWRVFLWKNFTKKIKWWRKTLWQKKRI